ncbi:class I SAM-dependent methyltransferase [Mycobacterium intracellulare]|uniref:class I SAM-dependent methyltransferase n=1 Tax=Mycobacterium intracellulare TaxID=1767 RepID=UPI003977E043
MAVPLHAQFAEALYREGAAPWDIGGPQPIIRQLIALGAVRGRVLDPGCGTGWHAIAYAKAGCEVLGIDAAPTAVKRARSNARQARVTAFFETGDAADKLAAREGYFDTCVDVKFLDNLEDTAARERYLAALHRAAAPGARLLLFGFDPTGAVNGFHNHEPAPIDYESLLRGAGFAATYVGSTTYQLNAAGWQPICPKCPGHLPGDRLHIPVVEVHAERRP